MIKDKLSSRKFIVFCIWTLLTVAGIFIKGLPIETIITYYGIISGIYIGANTASLFIGAKGKKNDVAV